MQIQLRLRNTSNFAYWNINLSPKIVDFFNMYSPKVNYFKPKYVAHLKYNTVYIAEILNN